MRYVLDDLGYIEAFSCNPIICDNKTCSAYSGTTPEGYSSLQEWAQTANIRAYKIVDGNLTYDEARATALEEEWECSSVAHLDIYSTEEVKTNKVFVDGKPIYRTVVQYNKTATGETNLNLSDYGINNVENIWLNHDSFIKSTYGEFKTVNNLESTTVFSYCNFPSTSKMRLASNNHYLNGLWTLIIEYTKTTD
jgi:hypothetical protein